MSTESFRTGTGLRERIRHTSALGADSSTQQEVTTAAATTLASLGLRSGDPSLDNSTGPALQGGIDYHLANNLHLNASLRWIDIDTMAAIGFANGSRLATGVEVDPVVYTLAVGGRKLPLLRYQLFVHDPPALSKNKNGE